MAYNYHTNTQYNNTFSLKSSISIPPVLLVFSFTVSRPAISALAAFVPCALAGTRHFCVCIPSDTVIVMCTHSRGQDNTAGNTVRVVITQ